MNKAFCKEPDASAPPHCPACGSEGVQVSLETLRGHAASAETLADPVYFCGTDACGVAYFDLWERTIAAADSSGLFWPKDPAGPLCNCLGLTADDVDRDVVAAVPERVRAVLRRAAAPDAACGSLSADGRPCTARVQRYFMRRRRELGG